MANSVMMFDALGYAEDHPHLAPSPACRWRSCSSSRTRKTYCQPCMSPVWDTALAAHALMEKLYAPQKPRSMQHSLFG